jgi:hypothetical protein
LSPQRLRRRLALAVAAVLAGALVAPGPANADAAVNDPLCLSGTTGSAQFANTAHIHDNYIHHNQHPNTTLCKGSHASGYGVETADGAYALIERNVFDWNRHDVAGDGRKGTGYFLHDNLILGNGGIHESCLGVTIRTHAIDMHAVNDCWPSDHNCGPAGEYMDISYNTVTYVYVEAIHLRGTPTAAGGAKVGMEVTHNVFGHLFASDAIDENETGLTQSDNLFNGLPAFNDQRTCDFDGDGVQDSFSAGGVGWWYQSSQLGGRWVFLRRSPVLVAGVTLADLDGDGRCDVKADGQVYYNPSPYPTAHNPGSIQQDYTTPANVQLTAGGGQAPYTWTVTGLPPGVSSDASGHITGRPAVSGVWSHTVTATVSDAAHQTSTVTFNWRVVVTVPNVLGEYEAGARSNITAAGLTVSNVSSLNNCVDTGTVQIQSPFAGTTTDPGAGVSITLSTCTGNGGGGGNPK